MGMFKNILVRAHHGDKEAVDKLYEQYKPLLRKYSFVNGVFDEDLHHILVIAFLEMIRTATGTIDAKEIKRSFASFLYMEL